MNINRGTTFAFGLVAGLILGVALCILTYLHLRSGSKWIDEPPESFFSGSVELPLDDIYEVPQSKFLTARMNYLSDAWIVEVDEDLAKYFIGPHFSRKPGQRTYLARAVCGNGGTGGYFLRRNGSVLLTTHSSLGGRGHLTLAAVVLNVDFKPSQYFVDVGFAL